MNDDQKILLIKRYMDRTLTDQEESDFFTWYHDVSAEEFHQLVQRAADDGLPLVYEEASPAFLTQLSDRLTAMDNEQKGGTVRKISRLWWAAAAVLVLAAGTWVVLQRPTLRQEVTVNIPVQDIAPGRNGAVLTLADGSQVTLDSLGNGQIGNQNGSRLILQNGSLKYDAANAATASYNTIHTPASRQFKLVLPDGSAVWLNAESAIRYPTAFNGADRTVEISGEAYFEVVPDATRPFRVKIDNKATIDVLGTDFNINAYKDELSIRATLLSGRVKVNTTSGEAVLQPGQQAAIRETIQVNNQINTGQVTAWKDGIFNFDELGVEEVMRQLARWYDIEVVYEKNVPDIRFYGEIGRNLSLSQVLEGLKLSGVNFRIEEDKRLVVLP
ncbi:FecR family protein [Chitinophaga rhizophila]|uniref:FecR domain-containing protein n=1 Tax=Chitinophaga rhizophila TaxID=2866212 RepID=A0ABS7G756_9BACT|nr:FecR family protein [Chitinophaga rhizophila]MBW8682970.1 FecR domain-containing protein [Chitinophaga rhizophila]